MKGEKTKANSLKNSQKATNGNHSTKGKLNHNLQSNNSNINNMEDDLVETDSDDTPSISSTDSGTVSESDSGKSSPPSSFPDPVVHHHLNKNNHNVHNNSTMSSTQVNEQLSAKNQHQNEQKTSIISSSSNSIIENTKDMTNSLYTSSNNDKILKDSGNLADTSCKFFFINQRYK